MLRKKHRPSASSDRAIHSRTNPLQLVGHARRRNTSGKSEQLGSRTCRQAAGTRYRRKASRVVTQSTSFTGWRQHAALASSLPSVDRLRGRRGNTKMRQRCQRPRSKRISFLERTGTAVPGRQTPSRSVDPAEASLDVVKRQAPRLMKWRKPFTREENRERGLAIG